MLEPELRSLSPGSVTDRSLAPRHEKVVNCLLEGWSNKRIARELSLSPRTVANYISEILELTGYESRTELISRLLRPR